MSLKNRIKCTLTKGHDYKYLTTYIKDDGKAINVHECKNCRKKSSMFLTVVKHSA